MKLLHTYCLNYNLGDYALGVGVKNILRHHLPVDLIGETNIQGRVFDDYYINEVVNKKYDLLVIGGGGIIHGSHWPNGWFWLIDKDKIKNIKIPFIVYGVGYNYWSEEGGIPERGKEHLKETKKYSTFFSVRNDGSAKRLFEQTGIQCSVVPDPGFHVNLDIEYPQIEKDKYVIIQLANDKPEYRFGDDRIIDIISSLRSIIKELAKKYKVILAPHVYDDIDLCKKVSNNIKNVSIWNFGYYAFDHAIESISYYKYAEFAIAMRGHGQIVPFAFNTPIISIENHPKHKGLMDELELSEYNINIYDQYFYDNIMKAIYNIERNKDRLIYHYKSMNNKMLEITNQNMSNIKMQLLYK